jgi:ubiquinone/menaquinone biosynthesis C-methylase UbiE
MSTTPNDTRREHPSTYFVQDRSNADEMTRLTIQDQMLTASMGGVLPEQPNSTIFQRVLDVGCGTGNWLIEAAKTYPTMSLLVGVDISSRMIEYARTQAKEQQVSDRVQFQTMDALRMLEFPREYFYLVNLRLGFSFLRTWDWPKLLDEFQRVTRPGGTIRVTECDLVFQSTSPALTRFAQMILQALYGAGHFFTLNSDGITSQLTRLLEQYGLQNVQSYVHALTYHAGTPQGQQFYDDMRHLFRTLLPFMRKWSRLPDDYESIYEQMLIEMQQPDFVAPHTPR